MFALIFALFVVAMVVLCALIMRWAIKHDLDARRKGTGQVSQPGDEMDR